MLTLDKAHDHQIWIFEKNMFYELVEEVFTNTAHFRNSSSPRRRYDRFYFPILWVTYGGGSPNLPLQDHKGCASDVLCSMFEVVPCTSRLLAQMVQDSAYVEVADRCHTSGGKVVAEMFQGQEAGDPVQQAGRILRMGSGGGNACQDLFPLDMPLPLCGHASAK